MTRHGPTSEPRTRLLAAWTLPSLAQAQSSTECDRYDSDAYAKAQVFTIKASAPKQPVNFQSEARSCPDKGACSWKQRSYLLPGRLVRLGCHFRMNKRAKILTVASVANGAFAQKAVEPSAGPPEPVSTVNATYVDPSSTTPLKPGDKLNHLFKRNMTQPYILQRIGGIEAMLRVRAGAEVPRRAADGDRPSSEPGRWTGRAAP